MKGVLLVFVFAATILSTANAQSETDDDKKKKRAEMFWIYGGPQYATLSEHDWKLGGYGGVLLQLAGLSAASALWFGPEYSCQGPSFKGTGGADIKTNLTYLNFPILYQYMMLSGLYLHGGLRPGILISAKQKYNDNSIDVKNSFKSFDLGIPFGIGYQSKKKWGVGLNIVPGILDASEGAGSHRNMTIGAQFNFRL